MMGKRNVFIFPTSNLLVVYLKKLVVAMLGPRATIPEDERFHCASGLVAGAICFMFARFT
jgi:hypothetical protein